MGTVIMQEGKSLDYYSKKLSKAQLNYAMTEKELLSIVETLKESQNILLGHEIEVFTDHNNLTGELIKIVSQCVQLWMKALMNLCV